MILTTSSPASMVADLSRVCGDDPGEEDKEHGPGVTPNPDKTTGPGIGLTGATVDNSPSPVPRKR